MHSRRWSVALTLILPALAAADWPLFRGDPLQTGVAAEPLPASLALRWQLPTGNGQTGRIDGAAAIVNGTVYVGSFDEFLYALDLATASPSGSTRPVPSGRRRASTRGPSTSATPTAS